MGVDFITCQNEDCSYNFPDCGDYNYCDTCESYFCMDCGDLEYDEEDEDKQTCMLCRKESVTSNTLLHFLLAKFSLTYDQAVELYKQESKDD